MNTVICPACKTRVTPKFDDTCPSCLAVIPKDIFVKNDNALKNARVRFWTKNTFISIPFVILIIFIILAVVGNTSLILGSLGIVKFAFIDPSLELFYSFCTLIGPLVLVAAGYAKLAGKTGIDFNLLVFRVFVSFSGFVICLFIFSDIVLSNAGLSQYKLYLSNPSTYIYIVFMLIGVFGILHNRYKKK